MIQQTVVALNTVTDSA